MKYGKQAAAIKYGPIPHTSYLIPHLFHLLLALFPALLCAETHWGAGIEGEVAGDWSGVSVSLSSGDAACALPPQGDEFIITVKTDNPGTSGSTSFTIPTTGSGYNYEVDWDNDGLYDETGLTGNATHDYGTAGTYTIRIRGAFPRIYFNNGGDRQKLLDIGQWGSIAWTSMASAFYGCSNLNISATDVPNLSGVTTMARMFSACTTLNGPANIGDWNTGAVMIMFEMFKGASLFNQPIGTWNTAAVFNMGSMFYQASAFNQPIGDWNTAAVTNMSIMFYAASAFDQPIGNWNTAAVITMAAMFSRASSFNQPIGDWNTATVTDMSLMFNEAGLFNQPIGTWNTTAVTDMRSMFSKASSFNQPIGNWNTAKVTDMRFMFTEAISFNQPIGDWNTAKVTDMEEMFTGASAFNQPIGDWNTAAVTNMVRMFWNADAFNQPIGNWNTAAVTQMWGMFAYTNSFNQPIGNWNTVAVTNMSIMFREAISFNQPIGTWALNESVNMSDMLNDCGMDCANYSATLHGWANNPATPSDRYLSASGRQYGTNAVAAHNTLTDSKGWTITGDAASSGACTLPPQGDEFIITVKTNNPGTSGSSSFTIPTTGSGYNYAVDWDNDGLYDQTGLTGDATHDYGTAGTYTLRIRGDFPRIYFNGGGDGPKLLDVGQWGSIAWTSMASAFYGCSILNISATDVPNLSGVADMSRMFQGCTALNGPANIGNWNTSAVTDMGYLFYQAGAFDLPIDNWNTSAVTDMRYLFYQATSFVQPIGSWNTAAVTNMSHMFNETSSFNQPIGDWNTEVVTDMSNMFEGAALFNQHIGSWNTGEVTDMSNMFNGASLFNRPIGSWNTEAVTNMHGMFQGAVFFNQPIGSWNTSAVTDMGFMFWGASSFNQPVENWNTAAVTDMSAMFNGTNLFNQPIGNWNTAAVTTMESMFQYAGSFDQPIGAWNTAAVTDMSTMFWGAGRFNQPIGAWNTAAVTDMSAMFYQAGAFNQPIGTWSLNASVTLGNILDDCGMDCANYSATLNGWANNPATPSGRSLGASGRQYGTDVVANRATLTGAKGWTITGDAASAGTCGTVPPQGNEFIITVKTDNPGSSNSTSFTIPTTGSGYNYAVDWNNDGLYDQAGITGNVTHNFGTAGTYTIRIQGAFPRIFFNNSGDRQKLLDIGQWGNIAWTSMANAFYGCSNLNISATDVPNLNGVTTMARMFCACTTLNGPSNIGDWNTGAVTSMFEMFKGASLFNQPIGNWNTAAVINMSGMFLQASAFNQPIGEWNTGAVTSMFEMFNGASLFNQPIGNWNTAAVFNMGNMFYQASAFNQPIGDWNTGAVTNMSNMFYQASAFNQPIGTWNTAAVTQMMTMFYRASAFNQPIGTWNTAKVKNMVAMFSGASSFNQPIGDWNTGAVTDMSIMFIDAGLFNQPIGTWNTAAVTNMASMFQGAASFNQPIGTWNTAAVTNMARMFQGAASFNQPIGTWPLNASVDITDMLNNCGMGCANYSATLIGWANNPATPSGRSLGATGRQYDLSGAAARATLTGARGWTINGDTQIPTANAGPDQTGAATCSQTSVTLAANSPSPGTGAWSVVSGTGGSFSNASSPTSTFSGTAGTAYVLRWTITTSTCTSTDDVAVSFNQAPSLVNCPPGVTVSAVSNCSAAATYAAAAATTVPAATVTYTFGGATSGSGSGTGSGSAFNLGTTTVNLTATNTCGTSSCSFNVVVQTGEINLRGNNTDIADGDATPSLTDHTDFGQTTGASLSRTFTVQNSGSANLNVTGITLGGANPGQFSLGALVPPSPVPPNGSATFTVTYAPSSAAIHNATVTLANGDCDESTYDFAIRGELTCTAPAFTACPSTQISLNTAPNTCSAIGTYTVSASGLPTPALAYAFTGATTGSGNGTGSGSSFNKGITTVTVTATNPCGAPVCSFSIAVVDNQLPSITCPGSSTVNASTGQCAAVVNYSVSGSDNCSGWSLSRTSGLASGSLFPVGTTTVSWKNTDGAGNSSNCSFTVTVTDGQLPGITCPANITANAATGSCAATVNYATPTVSDNCSGASAMHVSGGVSGSSFNKGVNTVEWKATDAANNTRTCSFSITVNDNQLPSITCPANLTANTGANTCAATVTFNNATATDNCTPPPTVAQTGGAASGSSFPKGLHTITFKATDGAGLTKTCTFRITVVDNVLPTITCPGNIVKNTDNNLCSAITSYTVTGADNCTSVSVSRVSGLTSGSAFPRGVNTVTWRATDLAGNVTLCSFTVTVNDAQGPTITCPQNINVNTTTGQCNRVVNYTTPTYSDNCTGGSISLFSGLASGSVFPTGSSTVIWRAFDNSANSNTCSFMVTVTDNELPVITCPPAASVSGSGSPCGYPANQLSTPAATDNCAVTSLASDAPATLPAGATTITWTAGDATGNQKTCAYTVTVNCGASTGAKDEVGSMRDEERDEVRGMKYEERTSLNPSSLISHPSSLTLFPNPASDMVVITLSNQPINSGSNQQPSASNQQINNTSNQQSSGSNQQINNKSNQQSSGSNQQINNKSNQQSSGSNQQINNKSNQQSSGSNQQINSKSNQQLFIHDALGRLVWSRTLDVGMEQVRIDLQEPAFADGFYQVTLRTNDDVFTRTLVVARK